MLLKFNKIARVDSVGAVKKGELKMKDEPIMLLKTHVEKMSLLRKAIMFMKNKLVIIVKPLC